MPFRTKRATLTMITAGLCFSSGYPAYAQSSPQLEEVVVTAQRRAESIQDIAMSISAIQGDALEDLSVRNVEDLAAFIPNLNVKSQSIGTTSYNIRGVGQSVDDITVESGVGVFVDDIYVPRMGPGNSTLYDLERVEVLRGPQGTLYGRNTVGGSINYITKKPTREFEGKLGLDIGNLGYYQAKAYVSGPLTDFVAGKISAVKTKRDGYVTNTYTGNKGNNIDSSAVRTGLLFGSEEGTQFLVTADYEHSENDGRFFNVGPESGFTSQVQGLIDAFIPGTIPPVEATDFYETNIDEEGYENLETWGLMARLDIPTESIMTSVIAGYRNAETSFLADRDLSPISLINEEHEEDSNWGSLELRLTSDSDGDLSANGNLDWTAGAYYFFEDGARSQHFDNLNIAPLIANAFGANFPDEVERSLRFNQNIDTEAYALFGEASYRITDKFRVTLGIRYTTEEKTAGVESSIYMEEGFEELLPGPPNAPPIGVILGAGEYNPLMDEEFDVENTDSWDDVTTKLSLEYSLSDISLLYLLYSQGFRSGGFQGTPRNPAEAATSFDPEHLNNYELGIKSEFFDQRIRLNAAAFYMDFSDLQGGIKLEGSTPITANSDAKIQGIELEVTALVTEGLVLTGIYGYIDSEYTTFEADPDRIGQQVNGVPESKYTLMADYTISSSIGDTLLHVDYLHEDATTGPLGGVMFAAYETVNGRVTFTPSNAKWNVSAWVRNASDEEYWTNAGLGGSTEDPFSIARLPALPRTNVQSFDYFLGN